MATAPVSRRLNLTRDQLAEFLTDQQQIRQFELLFATVDAIAPDVVLEINISAGTAQATAVQALGMIASLAQEAAVSSAVIDGKATLALDQIASLAQNAAVSIASTENKVNQVNKAHWVIQALQVQLETLGHQYHYIHME